MNKWPKILPPLTEEQKAINDDFVRHWMTLFPKKFGVVGKFNHHYVVDRAPKSFLRTLEIGAGLGEHLEYEDLTPEQEVNYVALELRENMAERIRERYTSIQTYVGDCQIKLNFADDHFDRILAIHVLEHLPNLPEAIKEMHRLCNKTSGVFSVVIPCEGGLAYSFGRRLSAQRIFESRYRQPYRWFIEREHINRPEEIIAEMDPFFEVTHRSWFPFLVPFLLCNLCIGLTLRPRHVS